MGPSPGQTGSFSHDIGGYKLSKQLGFRRQQAPRPQFSAEDAVAKLIGDLSKGRP
jgi:hypothetical protein